MSWLRASEPVLPTWWGHRGTPYSQLQHLTWVGPSLIVDDQGVFLSYNTTSKALHSGLSLIGNTRVSLMLFLCNMGHCLTRFTASLTIRYTHRVREREREGGGCMVIPFIQMYLCICTDIIVEVCLYVCLYISTYISGRLWDTTVLLPRPWVNDSVCVCVCVCVI